MMMSEFESRTGFYPSQLLYEYIENAYTNSKLDKDAFCAAYKSNKDGIAEAIARKASLAIITAKQEADAAIADIEKDKMRLNAQLESELEWQPYESSHNVKQHDYENLASAGGTRILTDDEAVDIITAEFGFDRSKISIIRSIDKEEINRHRHIRKAGDIERLPAYNATDFNYIRFDCAYWHYEMYNGQLIQFYC